MTRALSGRTVIELGSLVAAPFAAHILSQLGADVIKIEPPEGDLTRRMSRGGPGGTFIAYCRGKKSICLDLKTEQGKAVLEKLIAKADVVVHNLAPKSAERLGINYDMCRRIKPDIVYCHIQGYGDGPRHEEIASNPVVEASTGMMYSHRVDGRPMRMGPAYHDQFAGTYAAIGILAGLTAPKDDTKSRCVEIGLYETGLHIAARELAQDQLRAQLGVRAPDGGEFALPGYGAYLTADQRWIYVVMLTDTHWQKFCEAMSLSAEVAQAFATMSARKKNREVVEGLVKSAVETQSFDEVAARLHAAGVGFTEVRPLSTVLDDPQAQQPRKVDTFSLGALQFQMPNFPFQYQMDSVSVDVAPPLLGEHTSEVMQSLGYRESEIEDMFAAGAVARSTDPVKWAPARRTEG